eukprot:scaffold1724_cov246-Pinguiococcus_pyrenoidosus.AAC.21
MAADLRSNGNPVGHLPFTSFEITCVQWRIEWTLGKRRVLLVRRIDPEYCRFSRQNPALSQFDLKRGKWPTPPQRHVQELASRPAVPADPQAAPATSVVSAPLPIGGGGCRPALTCDVLLQRNAAIGGPIRSRRVRKA